MVPQARKPSSGSTIDMPAPPQHFDVGARRFVLPHVVIHGGREHHRPAKRQIEGGEKIVRQAVREFRQHVGRGGRDEQQIMLLRDADMLDRTGEVASGLADENRSVMTLRPVSEAKVRGRMNSSAARVSTACTS